MLMVDPADLRIVLMDSATAATLAQVLPLLLLTLMVEFRRVELHHRGNDTWCGSFEVTELGRHHYTVIAWVDAFSTWRRGLERKHAAGTDVRVMRHEPAAGTAEGKPPLDADDAIPVVDRLLVRALAPRGR